MSDPSDSRQTPQVTTTEEVMFFDTDCGQVVHNLAYLRMIETARTRLAAVMGMRLVEMAESRLFPVLVRTEIDYLLPAVLGDWLRIEGELESFGRARFWCRFGVYRQADGKLLVRARQQLALVRMPEGRPCRLPADWAGRFVAAQSE